MLRGRVKDRESWLDRLLALFRELEKYVDRPWYIPLLGALAALDLFVTVIPTDGLVISAALLKPRRWVAIAVAVSVGSTLGAIGLAGAIDYWGEAWVRETFPLAFQGQAWQTASTFLENYGGWAMYFFAAGPLPLQPAVIVCALSPMSVMSMALWMLAGRLTKYLLFAWGASHGASWMKKLRPAQKEFESLHPNKDPSSPPPT